MTQHGTHMDLQGAPPALLHPGTGPRRATKRNDLVDGFGKRGHRATLHALVDERIDTVGDEQEVAQRTLAGKGESHIGISTETERAAAPTARDTLLPSFPALRG